MTTLLVAHRSLCLQKEQPPLGMFQSSGDILCARVVMWSYQMMAVSAD